MKKRLFSLLLMLVLCMALLLPVPAVLADEPSAQDYMTPALPTGTLPVLDNAHLLTNREIADLTTKLQEISSACNAQIVVVTVSSTVGTSMDAFVNDVYDGLQLGYGANRDGVLLLISMEPRQYRILSNGYAGNAIDPDVIDAIGEAIVPDLSDGDYADAFDTFADCCQYYLDGYVNGFPFETGKNLMIALAVGAVAGVLVALILKGQLRSVHKQYRATAYIRPGSMNLTTCNDFFLYRTVDRRKRETDSSSGSSGSSRSVGGGSF